MFTFRALRPPRTINTRWIIVLILSALILSAANPTPINKEYPATLSQPETLLQVKSGEHLLGFTAQKVYLAAIDHLLSIEFLDSQPVQPVSTSALESKTQFGEPTAFQEVIYTQLWPGIDAQFTSTSEGIAKATYTLAPGADPDNIRLRYNVPVQLQSDGSLQLEFQSGAMRETPPLAWQEIRGDRHPVKAAFRLLGEKEVGFEIGAHNPKYPLVIDPAYQWHTFYGGSPDQQAYAITVDTEGKVYFVATVNSNYNIGDGFYPTTGYRHNGGYDIAVGSYTSTGYPSWVRLFGSEKIDQGYGIAIDNSSGNLYITGACAATWNGPGGELPYNAHKGGMDIVVIRMDTSGNFLQHIFFGSSYDDIGKGIAVSSDSKIIITGTSNDTWKGPSLTDPIRPFSGDSDIVVISTENNLSYSWHTFYGSAYTDTASGIALDLNNHIYISGTSDWSWTNGSTQPIHAHSGLNDITVIKLVATGAYGWHTFYGSSASDVGTGIAVYSATLSNHLVYVTGYSNNSWNGDAATPPRHIHSGQSDITVFRLSGNGAYSWHTFYGSSSYDEGRAISADLLNVYVVGLSSANWLNGSTTALHAYNGDNDLVTLKLNAADGTYGWHTFYGSSQKEAAWGLKKHGSSLLIAGFGDAEWPGLPELHVGGRNTTILHLDTNGQYNWHRFESQKANDSLSGMALDDGNNIILTGTSYHNWHGPANQAPKNPHGNVKDNAFVLKLDSNGVYLWHTFYGGSSVTGADALAITSDDRIYLLGSSNTSWNGPGSAAPLNPYTDDGASDIFVVSISSSGDYTWHTFYGGANTDWASDISFWNSGIYVLMTSLNAWTGPGGQAPLNAYVGNREIVLVKLNSSGQYQWHTFWGSDLSDSGSRLLQDGSGNLFISAISYANWLGAGNTAPLRAHTTGGSNADYTILKLTSAGGYLWHTFYGSTGDDFGYNIAQDSQGNLFLVGNSAQTFYGDGNTPPRYDPANPSITNFICVLSLTNSGNYRWHTFYGSDGWNGAYDVVVDSLNYLHVGGSNFHSFTGPDGQLPRNPHTETLDGFILTLTNQGDYVEHTFYGSMGADRINSVNFSYPRTLFVAGDALAPFATSNVTSPLNAHRGATDVFLMKMVVPHLRTYLPAIIK